MFPIDILSILTNLTYPLAVLLAFFLGAFLFWRRGKHELLESEFLFDIIIISTVSALFLGRMFDFLIRWDFYNWSFRKLVFFNAFGGFNFYGALFGIICAGIFFLRDKKNYFWLVFDLAAAPMTFLMSIVSLASFLRRSILGGVFVFRVGDVFLYYFIGYFLIFWILVRLANKKRHSGFLACSFLVLISILDLILLPFKKDLVKIGEILPFELIAPLVILVFSMGLWYFLAKRDLKKDLSNILTLLLLLIFKIKRVFSNIGEADAFAKSVLFSPYYLVKFVCFWVKLVGREIQSSLINLFYALGIKK